MEFNAQNVFACKVCSFTFDRLQNINRVLQQQTSEQLWLYRWITRLFSYSRNSSKNAWKKIIEIWIQTKFRWSLIFHSLYSVECAKEEKKSAKQLSPKYTVLRMIWLLYCRTLSFLLSHCFVDSLPKIITKERKRDRRRERETARRKKTGLKIHIRYFEFSLIVILTTMSFFCLFFEWK